MSVGSIWRITIIARTDDDSLSVRSSNDITIERIDPFHKGTAIDHVDSLLFRAERLPHFDVKYFQRL
jgi:hypothetical protein